MLLLNFKILFVKLKANVSLFKLKKNVKRILVLGKKFFFFKDGMPRGKRETASTKL
jgi:hypothetical protein